MKHLKVQNIDKPEIGLIWETKIGF